MSDISSPEHSGIGVKRRPDTLWSVLRSFSRLWGFLAFLVFVIVLFRGVALPFIFGLLVAYLLGPIIAKMQPRIGRVGAVVVCYVVLLGVLAMFFGLLLPAVAQDLARLRHAAPATLERINDEWVPRAEAWVAAEFGEFLSASQPPPEADMPNELFIEPLGDGTFRIDLENVHLAARLQDDGTWVLGTPIDELPQTPSTGISGSLREFLSTEAHRLGAVLGPAVQAVIASVAGFLTNFVLTFMIAAFVLVDMRRINAFVRSLIPAQYRHDFEELWKSMDRGLSGVIRGQLLICLVNGALTLVGLLIFDVKYSFLLALFAGALSLIPIFGTIVSSIPIVIIALVSSPTGLSFGAALGMLAWISGIHLLEANVFNPKIIGESANIHPVIVIFALLAGEHVAGLVGALLAIPATSLIQASFLHARRRSSVFSRDPDLL